MLVRLIFALVAAVASLGAEPTTAKGISTEIIAPLLDPAKIATLKGDRPVNTRLYKVLYWLETARRMGGDGQTVIESAQVTAGYAGSPRARADKEAILRNRIQLDDFGCFTDEGMTMLRKWRSPAITKGKHFGDKIALDHMIPRAVVPELDAMFYNLEAIPSRLNRVKGAKIGQRERVLANEWHQEGLLSADGLKAVTDAAAIKSVLPAS